MAKLNAAYRQSRFQSPPDAVRVLLIRHGESEAAVPGQPFPLLDGHGDPSLHAVGQQQAELLGECLKSESIDAVYVSNLCRTLQTAQPLCTHLGVEPVIDADFREIYLGDWEGGILRIKEHEQDPVALQLRQTQRWDLIPNAESNESLRKRVLGALEKVRLKHPNQQVAIVAHGGVIGSILAHATGAENFAFVGADNASISRLVLSETRIWVRGFNDTTHLRRLVD